MCCTSNKSDTMALFILQLQALWKAIASLQMMMSLSIWQKPILPTMPACTKGLGVTTDKPFETALPMGIPGTSWKVRASVCGFQLLQIQCSHFLLLSLMMKGLWLCQSRGDMGSKHIHMDSLTGTWLLADSPSQQLHKCMRRSVLSGCFYALSKA